MTDRAAPRLSIAFGATAEPLIEQIRQQHNGDINLEAIRHCQQDADALTRLLIRKLIAPAVVETARKRLMVSIKMAVAHD